VGVEYPGRGARKPTAGVLSSGRFLDFVGIGEIEAAAVCGDSRGQERGGAVRLALIITGDIVHAARDGFGDIDVGHFGAPGGWTVQRFRLESSLRHICPTIVIIGHTYDRDGAVLGHTKLSANEHAKLKRLIIRISGLTVS
jgi:hypothetical protein